MVPNVQVRKPFTAKHFVCVHVRFALQRWEIENLDFTALDLFMFIVLHNSFRLGSLSEVQSLHRDELKPAGRKVSFLGR